jgi:hypothetical protein
MSTKPSATRRLQPPERHQMKIDLDRLTREQLPYEWLCGEVSVNCHTLAGFRSQNQEFHSGLLTQRVATLLQQGLVELREVAQDGVRVRASAGAQSFRRTGAKGHAALIPGLLRERRMNPLKRVRKKYTSKPQGSSRIEIRSQTPNVGTRGFGRNRQTHQRDAICDICMSYDSRD